MAEKNNKLNEKSIQKNEMSLGITINKDDDINEWYSQVMLKSGFADYAPVKGCMIIKPLAYSCWEILMDFFNKEIRKKGVENAYFPMFIPESFFMKEAEHAQGFKPEVAWIQNKDDKQERLAIRPTSETIMYDSYSKWIRSYRDLPLKINQWCNICRWEVQDVKLFMRSREFLWQEGHCVYTNEEDCENEALDYLELYRKVAEELLAVPVIKGEKTQKERFAGAKKTFTIEGFMPDGKALQLGTTHNLGQGFAKAFNIKYMDKDEKEKYPWQNSWGISTRMLGALVMVHSDNKGLVLPPNIALNKLVIVPIFKNDNKEEILKFSNKIKQDLIEFNPLIDERDYSSGWKFSDWELKGVPLRIEIGPRDIENNQVVLVRRDNKEKIFVKLNELKNKVNETLENIQKDLFNKAKKHMENNIVFVKNENEFVKAIEKRKLIKTYFCCDEKIEDEIKEKYAVTSRCMPLNEKLPNDAKCFYTNNDAKAIVLFSKNY
jgi:prolyl-tRNA synthetase